MTEKGKCLSGVIIIFNLNTRINSQFRSRQRAGVASSSSPARNACRGFCVFFFSMLRAAGESIFLMMDWSRSGAHAYLSLQQILFLSFVWKERKKGKYSEAVRGVGSTFCRL